MAILNVPLDFATIAAAVAASSPGDTIVVDGAYGGNETVTLTSNLIVDAPASVTGIVLVLGSGVTEVTLLGDSDIEVRGNGLANTITGNDGDNTLRGNGGDDSLDGGTGDDWVSYQVASAAVTVTLTDISGGHSGGSASGGDGNDTLVDIERIRGSNFDDTLTGNSEKNWLRGGIGDDILDGGAGNDFADYRNASGSVTVTLTDGGGGHTGGSSSGADGNDTLIDIENIRGGDFDDVLTGNSEINVLRGGLGADILDGAGGFDYADYRNATSGLTVNLDDPTQNTGEAAGDTFTSIEGLIGSGFDDTLVGDADDNRLDGAGGADILDGGDGIDLARYKTSSEGLTVSLADPTLNTGDAAGDTYLNIEGLQGSDFDDTLTGDDNNNVLIGGFGADALDGGGGFDYASYQEGDLSSGVIVSLADPTINTSAAAGDTFVSIEGLIGSGFDDTLIGDGGTNFLAGMAGADSLQGGGGSDYADYSFGSSGVVASLADPSANTGDAAGDTYSSIENLRGSNFDDELTGDAGNNFLRGMAGDDVLDGGAGNDYADYRNASGSVTVTLTDGGGGHTGGSSSGADGNDTLIDIERIRGGNFDDTLTGNSGNNVLRGGLGADALDGGAGTDYADYRDSTAGLTVSLADPSANTGEAAGDTFVSIEGLIGSGFDDTLIGDGGTNFLAGMAGADSLQGGGGSDYADYSFGSSGVVASLADPSANTGDAAGDTYSSIENLRGSNFDDELTGDAGNNFLRGMAGDDVLDGGAGNDYADYRNARDSVTVTLTDGGGGHTGGSSSGADGNDTLIDIERIRGGNFDDTLTGNSGNNVLRGGLGADALDGGAGTDYADYRDSTAGLTVSLADPSANTGEAAGDTFVSIEGLIGSGFDDTLIGDGGTNFLAGMAGADSLQGGGGSDYADYSFGSSGVVASLADPSANTGDAAGDTYSSIENLRGSNFDDELTGDAGNNFLRGMAGDDVLDGGAGNDYADYRNARDSVTVTLTDGGGGHTGGSSSGADGNDTLIDIENIRGGDFDDTLTGNSGDNTFRGIGGDDEIHGGAGIDTAVFSGIRANYTITYNLDGSVTVADHSSGSPDGTDLLFDIEYLQFADETAGGVLTACSYYWYSPNSGDFYYGTVYDDGSYGYYAGQIFYGPNAATESGSADGYYYIYSSSDASGSGHSAGDVTGDGSYYDSTLGWLWTYYGGGTTTGTGGLGSEYNYAWTGSDWDYYGNDYYEVTAGAASRLTAFSYYWYSPNSGDFYYGTVYDDGSYGYYAGQIWYGPNAATESGSADGYYYIYSSSDASGSGHSAGDVTGDGSYYDSTLGWLWTYYGGGTTTGTSGLGSEYNYAWTGDDWDYYGNDWYEVTAGAATSLTAFSYYWYSPNSGDFYYGTVYDDGSYGYYAGQVWYGPHWDTESGSSDGYYYIYSGSDATGSGYSAGDVTGDGSCYDSTLGWLWTYYGGGTTTGTGGLGSEYNYAWTGSDWDYYGNDWYEVTAGAATSLTAFSYYWYSPNSGDFYYGTVYDDGSYGYYAGQIWYGPHWDTESGSSDGYYYIYSGSDATGSGYSSGDVTGDGSYYDSTLGWLWTWYGGGTTTGTGGLGSEYNYAWTGDDWAYYGNDWYEVDGPSLTAYYYYWYSPNSGDFYYGIAYDDGAYGYYIGQVYYGPYASTESGSSDGFYYIYNSSDATGSGYFTGDVTGDGSYYDSTFGWLWTWYGGGTVTGTDGLGSEYNYAWAGSEYQDFGGDYFEVMPVLNAYSFYWYSPNSGDFYYGTVYDDGTYGYYVGQIYYGPHWDTQSGTEDGYYYIFASDNAEGSGFDAGDVTGDGSYYDTTLGWLWTYYGAGVIIGSDGLYTESNYAWTGSDYGYFGNDWYEVMAA